VRPSSVPPAVATEASSVVRRAALLAAAAALGLLAGFGVGEGTPLVVLGGAALRLRGLPDFVTPDRGVGLYTLLGALHAGLIAYGWGLLASATARRLTGWTAVGALAALAAAVIALDPLLPTVLRLAAGAPSTGERVLCVLGLVAAAGLGTRLAPRRAVARGRAWAIDRVPEQLPTLRPAADVVTPDMPTSDMRAPDVPAVDDAHRAAPYDERPVDERR
jgi:hypothetical protein